MLMVIIGEMLPASIIGYAGNSPIEVISKDSLNFSCWFPLSRNKIEVIDNWVHPGGVVYPSTKNIKKFLFINEFPVQSRWVTRWINWWWIIQYLNGLRPMMLKDLFIFTFRFYLKPKKRIQIFKNCNTKTDCKRVSDRNKFKQFSKIYIFGFALGD